LLIILLAFSYHLVVDLSQDPAARCTNKRTCIDCPPIPHSFYYSSNNSSSYTPVKAAITILCREKDLDGVKHSLSSFEPYFNSKFNYPYVFINEKPFSDEFKAEILSAVMKYRGNSIHIHPRIIFSVIPPKDWDYPDFIDRARASENLEKSKNSWTISYGGLESYRFMIRYFSGPFFHNPDLAEFDYYWRGIIIYFT
jgi:alpha 1,2-mannosyltransferase